MHLLNWMMSHFGFTVNRTRESLIPREFMQLYERQLKQLRDNPNGFAITELPYCQVGVHQEDVRDYSCGFASRHIDRIRPDRILDIGSYRLFVVGLTAHYKVTAIDVRDRTGMSDNESVVTCDAKSLDLPSNEFDVVLSLCSVEHFGLGRYGDEFDLQADAKAMAEMIRVLKPGGRLILSTMITAGKPQIDFNAHRIYSYDMIRALFTELKCEEEKVFSMTKNRWCDLKEVHRDPRHWDVYHGCWQK